MGSVVSYSSPRGVTAEIHRNMTEYSKREKRETKSLAEVAHSLRSPPSHGRQNGPQGTGAHRRLLSAECPPSACPCPSPTEDVIKSEGTWYKARGGYFAFTQDMRTFTVVVEQLSMSLASTSILGTE